MRVVIFKGTDTVKLEHEINQWLDGRKLATVVLTQSSCPMIEEDGIVKETIIFTLTYEDGTSELEQAIAEMTSTAQQLRDQVVAQ